MLAIGNRDTGTCRGSSSCGFATGLCNWAVPAVKRACVCLLTALMLSGLLCHCARDLAMWHPLAPTHSPVLRPLPISAFPCCARPQPAPTTETEVFLNIFDYIDRLFSMVRPRKLLYMAIGEGGPGDRHRAGLGWAGLGCAQRAGWGEKG